ncbi:ABC transporter permease [Roseovarius sp.]|uniref:ABC transporter permease n=1 Tax=Roseovarius sp. TaxID=1486281 RepID=UPI002600C1A1|nr:ABC transporter permease subunit [Roseovarius sp.]
MIILIIYVAIFAAAFFAVRKGVSKFRQMNDYTSLKTVTFGDESAVRPDRWASVISVVTIFLLWGAFTGSKWVPIHAPGPFIGDTEFVYTLEAPDGTRDDATVYARVFKVGEEVTDREVEPGDGFAKNDVITVGAWRSSLLLMDKNDEVTRKEGAKVVAIDGQPVAPGQAAQVANGTVAITAKGSLNFAPAKGMQMEPIWLPPPESVVSRVAEISEQGYQNFTLFEHLYWSLFRVIVGFALGALVGIPLGYAMGLSDWFRGWFDPIVEFMRPVPPLALIPLVIIWAGIGESGKIILLFLAALWIMTISARAGVSGVAISKVHAAYSLGASKWQLMRHVIVPNSLPEIFTGARVAMGVCWGTVVAAELVAAEKGAGMMIMVASRFQLTDIVIMGIILIGIIGYGIDILMRKAETWLVPWKGRV